MMPQARGPATPPWVQKASQSDGPPKATPGVPKGRCKGHDFVHFPPMGCNSAVTGVRDA